MVLTVDAREVLDQLNDMGYRNISAEQLKEFMKDLKKLIKYEERFGAVSSNYDNDEKTPQKVNNLHKTLTASYIAKMTPKHHKTSPQKLRKKLTSPMKDRSRNMPVHKNAVKQEKCVVQNKEIGSDPHSARKPGMWIRPKSGLSGNCVSGKTNDPVKLYQYYKNEWKRFKQNLPGENDHTDLRWNIRHKLLGS